MSSPLPIRQRLINLGRSLQKRLAGCSLTGVSYIVEKDAHWLQRVIFSVVFACGIFVAAYFCDQMWQKWTESPVLLSLDTNRYPLRNIPFPAITICSVNKVSKSKLLQVLSQPKYANVPYETMKSTLRYMTKLDRAINSRQVRDELRSFTNLYQSQNITENDLFQVLQQTAPTCEDLVVDCTWQGNTWIPGQVNEPCLNYFSFRPTDDGICCIFNGGDYMDPALGLNVRHHDPLQTGGNGYRSGLSVVLHADVNDYSVTNAKFNGFKVLVHAAEEFPDVNDRSFVLGPGTETFAAIRGVTTFNTKDVAEQVSPSKRQCQVEEEHKLDFFSNYSQSACVTECATKRMQRRCGCRPYFFRAGNNSKICGLGSYICINEIFERVYSVGNGVCRNCLPSCTDVWFNPEISYAPFPGFGFNSSRTYERVKVALNLTNQTDENEFLKTNVAQLHVYYRDWTGVRYKTDVRYGLDDFISNMGGLVGLGIGASLISFFEIFYIIVRALIRFFMNKGNQDEDKVTTPLLSNKDEPSWPPTYTGPANAETETVSSRSANLELTSTPKKKTRIF